MASKTSDDHAPELRELIKEYSQSVYDFSYYMLSGGSVTQESVLAIFREFGDLFRKISKKRSEPWNVLDVRVRLFGVAWKHLRHAMSDLQYSWSPGRDTRNLRNIDEDLLGLWKKEKLKGTSSNEAVFNRLKHVDPEFRAPLVLKDILRFEDDEIVRILGTRWGVYRHRLHRGRLEFKDGLRGRPISSEAKGYQPAPSL